MVDGPDDNDRAAARRDLAGKILSACFTLLGILIGVFGILFSEFKGAGPSIARQVEPRVFLSFLAIAIAFDCLLCLIAVLNAADYLRTERLLVSGVGVMLILIAFFVIARAVQTFV